MTRHGRARFIRSGSAPAPVLSALLSTMIAISATSVLAIGLAGCASSPRSSALSWLLPIESSAERPIEVLLTDPVDRVRVPLAATEAERIVFGHLYEGLASPGSDGRPVPQLAEEWRRTEDRIWSIRLKDDLRFADGTSLGARDVASAWTLAEERFPDHPVWAWFSPREIRTEGLVLEVVTRRPCSELPTMLLDPILSVWGPRGFRDWPVGTGPLWFPRAVPVQGPLRAAPNEYRRTGRDAPVGDVVFRVEARLDPRDLVGSDADAIVVRDRRELRFLEDAGFRALPLPWDRVYCWGAAEAPPGVGATDLAELVVGAEARPWSGADSGPVRNRARRPDRVFFPSEDRDAGRIARRLAAAIGSGSGGATCVARAIEGTGFPAAVGDALVVPVDLFPGPGSRTDVRIALLEESVAAPGAEAFALVPLVETRARLVHLPGLSGVWVDGFGRPRFEHAGRRPTGTASVP